MITHRSVATLGSFTLVSFLRSVNVGVTMKVLSKFCVQQLIRAVFPVIALIVSSPIAAQQLTRSEIVRLGW